MQANSVLSLNKYVVKKIQFSINENFEYNKAEVIELQPEFTRHIRKIDENNALVNLFFCIQSDKEDIPFNINIDIEGLFYLENWEQPDKVALMVNNSIAILFPYLRSLVSMITANANISPYILPVMNINALFANDNMDVNHENE